MGGPFRRFERDGLIFVFKVDPDDPRLLHIYARHLKEPDDAIRVWFEGYRGVAPVVYQPVYERYETYHEGIGVYWFWIVEDRVAMIVSCFDVLD